MLSNLELSIELIKLQPVSHDTEKLLLICDFVSAYIQKHCNKLPKIQKIIHNNYPTLIVSSHNLLEPTVCLYAHLDVVAGKPKQFEPKVVDNWLIGRGSGDMLGASAASINTFIKTFNTKPNLNIGLFLPCDEELGGTNGSKYCVEELKYNPETVLMPDSGSSLENIVVGQKGFIIATLKCKGKPCHSSRPWEGKNPINKLLDILNKIQNQFQTTGTTEYFSTITPTQIQAGESMNKVPSQASLTIDMRTCNRKDHNKLLELINNIQEPDISIELLEAPAFNMSSGHPHIDLAREITEGILNKQVNIIKEHGGSDARFFQKKVIPCIINGIRKENSHGDNEKVYIPEIDLYEQFASEYIIQYHQKFIGLK